MTVANKNMSFAVESDLYTSIDSFHYSFEQVNLIKY